MRYPLFFLLVLFFSSAYCQDQDQIEQFIPTENITKKKVKKKKNSPNNKKIIYITKNDSKGILYGNPCLIEETQKMGFEYSIQKAGIPGSLRKSKKFRQNTMAYIKLIITKSPFWKLILNNRVKDCRKRTGDFVG